MIRLYKEQHGEAETLDLRKAQSEGAKILFSNELGGDGAPTDLSLAKFALLLDANEIMMTSPAVQVIFSDIDNAVAGNSGVVTVAEFEAYISQLDSTSEHAKAMWIGRRLIRMPPFWATCACLLALFLFIGNLLIWRHGDAEVIKHLQRFATVLFWFGSSVGVLLVFKVESEKFWEFEEGVTALHHTVLRMAGEKVVEPANPKGHWQRLGMGDDCISENGARKDAGADRCRSAQELFPESGGSTPRGITPMSLGFDFWKFWFFPFLGS